MLQKLDADRLEALSRLADRRLLSLLVLAYVLATVFPGPGIAIRSTGVLLLPLPVLLLMALLFAAGLGLDRKQLAAAVQWRWLVLAGQATLWGAPLVLLVLFHRLPSGTPPGLLAGLGLVALMPVAASSVAWAHLSYGNTAISLSLLAVSTLLTPLVLLGLGQWTAVGALGELKLTANSTALGLIGWIIPAFLAGAAVRRWLGRGRVESWRVIRRLVCVVVLLLLNYSNAAIALPRVLSDYPIRQLATVALMTWLMCVTGFVVGWVLTVAFRVETRMRSSFIYGLGMKNTGMALVLAGVWFETMPLATLVIVLYTLFQHIIAATYHRFHRHSVPAVAGC